MFLKWSLVNEQITKINSKFQYKICKTTFYEYALITFGLVTLCDNYTAIVISGLIRHAISAWNGAHCLSVA